MKESSFGKNNPNSSIAVPLALFVTTSLVYYHRLLLRDYQRLLRLQQRDEQDDEHGNTDDNDEHFETMYKFRRSRGRLSFDASHPENKGHKNDDSNHEYEWKKQKQEQDDDVKPKKFEPFKTEMDQFGENMRRSHKTSFWVEDALPRFSRACSMDYHYSSRSNWSHFEEFAEDSIKIENQGSIISRELKLSTNNADDDLCASENEDEDPTKKSTVKNIEIHSKTNKEAKQAELLIQKVMNQKENETSKGHKANSELSMKTMKIENLSTTKVPTSSKNEEKKENSWVNTFFRRVSSSLISNGENSEDDGTSSNDEMNESYAGDECDAVSSSSPIPRSSFSTTESTTTNLRHSLLRSSTSMPVDNKRIETARTDYNARIMPSKVIMVRHGQSEGNVSENLYAIKPDNAMQLTELGWDQAKMAGKALRERVLRDGESVHFIVSPYVRTLETFHGIISAWCDPSEFDHIENHDLKMKAWYEKLLQLGLTWHEDPRIREQDFGNYQDPATIKKCKGERHNFGAFYYRFPHGESASDVFDRVSTFLDSLWRSFDLQRSRNYVLITHGISIRVLLARYFRYSIDQFNMLANPKNCEMVILGHDGMGKLRLDGRCQLELKAKDSEDSKDSENSGRDSFLNRDSSKTKVVGYKFHERLRVVPKKFVLKRCIRMSHDDTVCATAFPANNTS